MDFIFDPSLVLYLPLDQLDGASFMSRDKSGHLCTVTGAVWRPQGRSFDGTDDCLTVPNHLAVASIFPYSLELWIKHDRTQSAATSYVIDGNKVYRLGISSAGLISLWFYDGSTWQGGDATTTLPDLTWAHLLATMEANGSNSRLKCFLNGQLDSTNDFTNQPVADLTDLVIGGKNTQRIKGTIGEVRIYSRALTPVEIQHNYMAAKWRGR